MENAFEGGESGEGRILKSALDVSLNNEDNVRITRDSENGNSVNVGDFSVAFMQNQTVASEYTYSEMPEVVTLPAGKYTCNATYGDDRSNDWESEAYHGYYLGTSNEFTVAANSITSSIDPIVCRLQNVKVSVTFDNLLASNVEEPQVSVKVDTQSPLVFTKDKVDEEAVAYFRCTGEQTLVATFSAKIEGSDVSTTQTYTNIVPGSHYRLNFRLHDAENSVTGASSIAVSLETHVTVDNVDQGISTEDQIVEVNPDEHPSEGPAEDPNDPGNNDDPIVSDEAPSIVGVAPVDLNNVNDGNSITSCILNVHSSAEGGITAFTCDIVSEKLTAEELEDMGLSKHLDLVNPGASAEPLSGLGFPVNVGGQHDVKLDLTGFLGLMKALGQCKHEFVITVADANGSTTKTLSLQF